MKRSRLLFLPVALAALTMTAALAAASYDHSSPAPEQSVAVSPQRVDIYLRSTTSAVPGDTQMTVIDRDQHRVDLDNLVVDPSDHRHFFIGLQPSLQRGRYVVTFKTLAERDLDHDGGNFAFYVGVQPSAADRAADKPLTLTVPSEDVGLSGYRRGIVEGGLALVIAGPAAFYYVLRRRRRAEQRDTAEGGDPPAG